MNATDCLLAEEVFDYHLYRFCVIVPTVQSFVTIPLLVSVFLKHILPSAFHKNLKLLLAGYFFVTFVHAVVFVVMQVDNMYRWFLTDPCEKWISGGWYAGLHIVSAACNLSQLSLQCSLWIERVIATLRVENYEKDGGGTGAVLLVLGLLLPVPISLSCYSGVTFAPSVNALNTPLGAGGRLDIFFGVGFAFSLIGLFVLRCLLVFNRNMQKRAQFVLSVRYQSTENVSASELMFHASSLQLSLFLLYTGAVIGVSNIRPRFIPDRLPLHYAARMFVYIVPTYNLILPLFLRFFLLRLRSQRGQKVKSLVKVTSPDAVGEQYQQMLRNQWRT